MNHDVDEDEDLFAEEVVVEPKPLPIRAEVVTPKTREEMQLERIKGIEDRIFEQGLSVVEGVMAFSEIQPDDLEPPESWVAELGEEGALKRFRLAKEGWKSSKESPVAIKVATSVVAAVAKARATEKAGPKVLNFAVVQMSAPLPEFPVLEVEPDDRRR